LIVKTCPLAVTAVVPTFGPSVIPPTMTTVFTVSVGEEGLSCDCTRPCVRGGVGDSTAPGDWLGPCN
jgi:hypothetical protein